MAGYKAAIPNTTELPYSQFTLHLFRYFSTFLTFHALTVLLFTHPLFRRLLHPLITPILRPFIRIGHFLRRLWQKLIEIPPRRE